MVEKPKKVEKAKKLVKQDEERLEKPLGMFVDPHIADLVKQGFVRNESGEWVKK